MGQFTEGEAYSCRQLCIPGGINAETEAAIEEARAIMDGRIQAKQYSSVQALF